MQCTLFCGASCSVCVGSMRGGTGGHAKVVMLVHVSPSDKDASETMASLNFATKARGVELGPAKRQADTMALKGMVSASPALGCSEATCLED